MTVQRAFRFLAFGFLLLVIPVVLSSPSAAQIGVGISVQIGPPALPVYEQPICPSPGYMWTPGYWAWDDGDGYYWVPGTWVEAPEPGLLWTPGYWGWNNGFYVFNAGYWGPHVGFYGGINYGYGYDGAGYRGGYWDHGRFNYNRNVGYNNGGGRVSYNGGRGGLMARPTPQDQLAVRDRHTQPLATQQQQIRMASQNRALRASVNHGAPPIAATSRPGAFSGNGVVGARGATTRAMNTASTRTSMATSTNRMNGRSTSRATVNAGRSGSNVPRNGNVQRSMQTSRASSYARPTGSAGGYQGATRPAASAYRPAARPAQQARPQAHAQPARGGGDRERH